MSVRQQIIDYSKGDHLGLFWRLFAWRSRTASRRLRAVQTFFLNRSARRHGGYIGKDAAFAGTGFIFPGMPVLVRIAASIKTLPLGRWTAPRRRSGIIA